MTDFEKEWLKQIKEISKKSLSPKSCKQIIWDFNLKKRLYVGNVKTIPKLTTLESKLIIALESAESKYRSENPWWAKIPFFKSIWSYIEK